jgi:outer membrane receptor for monomeric catechols
MEVAREDYFRRRLSSVGTVNTADPFNPDPFNSPTPSYIPNGNFSEAQLLSTSVYLFDTIEVTPWLDITGGARFDRIDIDIATQATRGGRTDDIASGRAAAIFKPSENGSIYFGWGTSYEQAVETVLLLGTFSDVEPIGSETFELGTKRDLLDEKLTLRMNANNIADKDYIGTVASGHSVPGEGRSVMFTASMEF